MYKYIHFLIALLFWSGTLKGQETREIIKELEKQQHELELRQIDLSSELEIYRLNKIREDLHAVGLPVLSEDVDDELVEHGAMILSYNERHEQANWVSHIIIPAVNKGNLPRTNDFRKDSLVKSGTAVKSDYWYSGFDRGHLAPSADFRWSPRAISESYVYSNISPQRPEFNREIWAKLESFVRKHVWVTNEQLIVVTGPIYDKGLETITQGPNVVSIPNRYFKLILDIEGDEKKAIAFLMPNASCKKPFITYATTIDEVEKLTGIDFFSNLPEDLQSKLESTYDFSKWEALKEGEIPTQNPLGLNDRPNNTLNSVEADLFVDKKACVCGVIVSTRKTSTGSVFFNFDSKFPNHTFSGSIWSDNVKNFTYEPEIEFLGKKICISGKIREYKGKPTMNVEHEKKVTFLDHNGRKLPK
ncbi:MAG: DNA/RNA non-specific endonuclease [Saprospiraceae bacterium]|nr:DNA/RNA non-specific endonuclease [Saprospiraceae bacterium]